MNWLVQFWQYMFAPVGQPFYYGAFWSNQVQWTIVTLPTLLWALWRIEKNHKKRHEELKQQLKEKK